MQEVIRRRLARYQEEEKTGEGFGKLPDLILLDGGKGHVAAILPVIAEFGLEIPVFGMVRIPDIVPAQLQRMAEKFLLTPNRQLFVL